MKEMKLVYAAIIFLVSEAWSLDQAFSRTNQSTSEMKLNATSSSSPNYVFKYSSLKLGRDANLTCGDKTWTEMMFVIWKLRLKNKDCDIAFHIDGQNRNTCNDGKSLQNTSEAQSFLFIPNFSFSDVGIYKCESVFSGGAEAYSINVSITVPPKLSSWLDWKGNKMVAVCKAEGGIPAANISWSHTGNTSTVETRDSSDGFFTVESRLELPTDMQTENVSCAISHLSWEHEESLMIKIEKGRAFSWVHLAIPISIAFFLGFLFFGQKKLVKLRRGQESVVSSSKSPQTDDVEEVEPYASYVQRVNSIYNSSLDMFT
ncbi:cell surface glycoprotein CD200 receptor 1 isoform X2 [Sphaeramia orbicularis]|uniref:cell surface glycoprotein CD200 receptor 1 isoform X2 n=1 Tax=Sphaeramia orbicularis TaxID=375764 RepID=UPI00117D8D53|nr:cell surface glycoprotein CD200 receptor 1-like isoform X2 [Sphaeramia orbicularis]